MPFTRGLAAAAGPGWLRETIALAQAFQTPPSGKLVLLMQRAVVKPLKDAGTWAKLDVLSFRSNQDEQSSLLNWITAAPMTKVGTVTFTAFDGAQGDGSTGYIDTLINPATAPGAKFKLPDASMGVGILTESSATPQEVSLGTAVTNGAYISPRAGTNLSTRANSNSTPTISAAGTSLGLYAWSRLLSTEYRVHKNGALLDTPAVAATSMQAGSTFLIGRGNNGFSARKGDIAWFGGGLSDADNALMKTVWDAWRAGIAAL